MILETIVSANSLPCCEILGFKPPPQMPLMPTFESKTQTSIV